MVICICGVKGHLEIFKNLIELKRLRKEFYKFQSDIILELLSLNNIYSILGERTIRVNLVQVISNKYQVHQKLISSPRPTTKLSQMFNVV